MRKLKAPSEIGRLAAPVSALVDGAWQRMHWWIATMAILYAVSGITIVKPDEAAVVLRWGRLVGDTPALQAHLSGLLFAFPRPVDRVVRVPVKHVSEVRISTLAAAGADEEEFEGGSPAVALTLDPLRQGYALTGDHNIVQVDMVARYRVRDPAEWAFYGPKAEQVLKVAVSAAMMRSLGEMQVDRVLADGRKDLIATATRRAQAGLDASHSGLELSSLELTRLSPPVLLAGDFDAVQSAYIGAETLKKNALSFAESAIPRAQATADSAIQTANAASATEIAQANGAAAAFQSLAKEYHANPAVVRERLYRDAVERAIGSAGNVQWVPPPPPGGYKGFRITISPTGGGFRPGLGGDDDDR
jgi:membrane protease subunit HflK